MLDHNYQPTGYYHDDGSSNRYYNDYNKQTITTPKKTYTYDEIREHNRRMNHLPRTPTVSVLFESPIRQNPGGHSAIKIDNTIYEIDKLQDGNGLVIDSRTYDDITNDNRSEKWIKVDFLSTEQIIQLENNLKQSVETKINYNYIDNNCCNFVKDHFGKIGASFPDNYIDTPTNTYNQTIKMNQTYTPPVDWRIKGSQFGTTSYDVNESIRKATKPVGETYPKTFNVPAYKHLPVLPHRENHFPEGIR